LLVRAPAFGLPALVIAAMLTGTARRAVAGEPGTLGASPWFPLVNGEQDVDDVYQQNTLAIVHIGADGWRANRGKYRSLLTRHDFYVTVGRTDLARHDSASAATSRLFFWSGIAGVAVGALLFYAHVSPGGTDPGAAPGLILAGAGLTSMYVSSFVTGPSVEPEEAEEMAQRYNEHLKQHLEAPRDPPGPGPMQVGAPRLLPWTDGRAGGGLSLLATF
jgi:hypothetical protein